MKQDKNKWVEDVLSSADGMVPARPNTGLYAQVKSRLGRELPGGRRIPLGVMSAAAACLLVLLALNITAITRYTQPDKEQVGDEQGTKQLIEYYQLGSNSAEL